MVDFHQRETTGGHRSLRGDGPEDGPDDGAGRGPATDDAAGREPAADGGEDAPGEGPDEERRGEGDAHHDHHGDDGHDHDAGHHAHDLDVVRAAVVTVSSTRSLDDDPGGDAVAEAFEAAGHAVSTRELVTDDRDGIEARVDSLCRRDDVDVVVTTGGTGVSPDDVTVEAVDPLFDTALPGFGELFRRRSEADIGTRVVATRATAGLVDGVPVFCLPGSEAAARLGAGDIVVPEAPHLVGLARRGEDDG